MLLVIASRPSCIVFIWDVPICSGKAYNELAAQEGALSSLSGLVLQQQAGTLRLSPGTGVFMSPTEEKLKGESLPAALSLYNRITNGVHQRTVWLLCCFAPLKFCNIFRFY